MTPKTRRRHPAAGHDVHAADLCVFCYNFAAALALYYTTQNLFTILQLYQNRNQPLPVLEKVDQPRNERKRTRRGRTMTPAKELLDTMLGYLGFVVQIDETQSEGGNPTCRFTPRKPSA